MDPTPFAGAIDISRVSSWLEKNLDGAAGPFDFQVISGGHSNITFLVRGVDGRRFVLRRPPLGMVLATAHDMTREWRLIQGLQGTTVPVPPALALCEDASVNGAPFYVMGYVEGVVVRDRAGAERLTPEQRRRAGLGLAEALAALHAVDPDEVGLGDLGRRDGYVERQLRRWIRQWHESRTRDLPLVDDVHARLAQRIPEQQQASIVHGDFRLDNCMTGFDGRIAAVLDWELCTLGDPMADVGLLSVYHIGPDDPPDEVVGHGTDAPGFPNRREVIAHYGELSGRDLSQLPYYVAFSYWKLACILEGVLARYLGNVMGTAGDATAFRVRVERSIELAARLLDEAA